MLLTFYALKSVLYSDTFDDERVVKASKFSVTYVTFKHYDSKTIGNMCYPL